ncbi:MAG: hypothetical protein LBL04_14625 [Bacteroidales bacterium]|jgi:hypothetical protein|nr:hypothetical protein [Bacteroidales bacterium]
MASKRALKKNINLLTGELLNECFAFSYFHPHTQPKQVTETMWALAHTRNELISRINRKMSKEDRDKQSIRSFYKALKGDVANMPVLMDHFAG